MRCLTCPLIGTWALLAPEPVALAPVPALVPVLPIFLEAQERWMGLPVEWVRGGAMTAQPATRVVSAA